MIRRVTFDLTGLPPTPAEISAFLADTSPDAYEKVVDRLLASPRYGERMAADWLDVARYSDTHGYQMDRYRPMWPYRDWVIKAFNENLPYDQFVSWQLAGDLLPNPTKDQRLATAFNRLHMQNEEGGIVAEEFRVAYNVDRVTTAGTAFLGLTFECARCHDHKFDPITQRDFYSLFAFFQNVDESGQTSYFTDATPTPALSLTTDDQDAKLTDLRKRIAARETELSRARQQADASFQQWKDNGGRVIDSRLARVAWCTFDDPADTLDAKPVESPTFVEGRFGKAAQFTGDNGFTLPARVGQFTKADEFSLTLWVNVPDHAPTRMVLAHKSKASADAASRGYEILLEDGHLSFGLHHFWPGDSIKITTKRPVPVTRWTHLAVTYDGSSRAAGVKIYVDGVPADVEVVRDHLTRDITYGKDEPPLTLGYRFRDAGFKGGRIDEFCVYKVALTAAEIATVAGLTPPPDSLPDYYVTRLNPQSTKVAAELAQLRRQYRDLLAPVPQVMVMQELPVPKPAYILKRGAYDAPGEQVTANTPGFLPPFPADQPRNRLGFARWLFDGENPLTARVAVNRAWQQLFGRGLVETSENFGTQGSQPTNQPLLDHLACQFRGDMAWNTKKLLKTIALSATYRQTSLASRDLLSRDKPNTLLARGPEQHLAAEMIRDQALFDAGLLVERLGGPSVKPYQPEGLWDVAMGRPIYDQSHGDDLYRRTLYTFSKRSVPPPALSIFDAADKNVCTVRRQTTSTPLQALALLNDPQIVEAARFVAQRMLTEGGSSLPDRLTWTFRLVTSRLPTDKELHVLQQLYDDQRDLYAADPKSAETLLTVGEKPNDPKLDKTDLAAATTLALALFNHDDAVMRR